MPILRNGVRVPRAVFSLPWVCRITGRSPASIWRDVAAGRLGRPVRVGVRAVAWRRADLSIWCAERGIDLDTLLADIECNPQAQRAASRSAANV